jgi:epoxide hydrolase 4
MLKHAYASVNGVRLHYVSAGQGRLVLFLHGFPEFWFEWKKQLAEFGRDHQAVAPDLRGYNFSSKPPQVDQYRMPLLAEDVRALAEYLGRDKLVLVGHDWGGAIAWAFAILHPAYVEKLVIINAPHPAIFQRELGANPAQQTASQYMLMLRSPGSEALLAANNYAALVDAVLRPGFELGYFTEPDLEAYLEAWSQPGALTGGVNYYRALLDGAGNPSAAVAGAAATLPSFQVSAPTLVIWGEKDSYLLSGNLEGLETFVPNLALRRVPDASHWVVHEKPELVNSLIREFIVRC